MTPTLTIEATADGRAVSATVSAGDQTWATPTPALTLEKGKAYAFHLSHTSPSSQGKRWASATLNLTADWKGSKTERVALEESKGPALDEAWTIPDLGMTFRSVAAGSFQMGSNDGGSDEEPVHTVRLTRDYWMGKTEVTQAQYEQVTEKNPSNFKGSSLPVEQVSWNDAVSYCTALTERERRAGRLPEGYKYRLPTEAEWEYAARGGNKSRGYTYSGGNDIGSVGWYGENSENKMHPVGQKGANELGLNDMSGNVRELCLDWYGGYPSGAVTDPSGPASGSDRVGRGGGWLIVASLCRVANILGSLGSGASIEEVLEDYPSMTREDLLAALQFAGELSRFEVIAPEPVSV